VQAPHREIRGLRAAGDLTEERVGLLESIEPVVGLGEPVARLGQKVALLPAAHRRLEVMDGIVELALGVVGAATLSAFDAIPKVRRRRTRACLSA
jgi:hypothetical protein